MNFDDPLSPRNVMALALLAICREANDSQEDKQRQQWCADAPGANDPNMKNIVKLWARVIVVLKLPEDVRRAAEWN